MKPDSRLAAPAAAHLARTAKSSPLALAAGHSVRATRPSALAIAAATGMPKVVNVEIKGDPTKIAEAFKAQRVVAEKVRADTARALGDGNDWKRITQAFARVNNAGIAREMERLERDRSRIEERRRREAERKALAAAKAAESEKRERWLVWLTAGVFVGTALVLVATVLALVVALR